MSIIRALLTTCAAWTAVAAIAAGALGQEREKTILLHSCESAQGVTLSWGAECSQKQVHAAGDSNFLSQGKGSLHLTATSRKDAEGSCYVGVVVPLEHADADCRAVLLDCWTSTPEATQAVYLRLYGPKGRKVAGWSNWNSPFRESSRLQLRLDMGLGDGGFSWEAKDSDATGAGDLVAAEIVIGTRDRGTPLDIYIDNLRITDARRVPFSKVTDAKKLFIETPLARGGKAEAIIVTPGGAFAKTFAKLAASVQAKIKDLSGAELPILDGETTTFDQLTRSHAILLGNVANNRAMIPAYAHLYTPADGSYPPGDGHLVHTVHDPWGTGKNVVIIGGSTQPGTAKAVEAFLRVFPKKPAAELVLPKLNLFALPEDEMKQIENRAETLDEKEIERQVGLARRDFARGAHRSVATRMGKYGFEFAISGNPMLARLYKELALAWYESYQAKPEIYGGPWGMDMDFHLMEILPAWDLLEESPALGDEDRLKVSRVLHEFVETDVVRKAAGTLTSKRVRHNHATFPALGLYFAGRYFKQGYHSPEADYWLEIARACFTCQMLAAKPYEDCNGYGWLVPYHTMRYALATLDPTYFDNGNVRLQADYAILTMDNLGYQVPYGDTGSYECWWTEIPFLRGAAFAYRDGRYAWALEKKAAVHHDAAAYQYACPLEPVEPVDLLGARAIPLDRMYWKSLGGPETIALEKAVDKVVMRASFDPGRQYLLLDGLSNGGHMHEDGNSIPRITDRGRIWLADNDYIRSQPKFHNSMLVLRDGQAEPMPPYCELLTVADAAWQGLSETVVRDYAGVDWHRAILWSKERFFVVIDELVARRPAEYDFHCFWHTVGDARLTDDGLEVEQQGPKFFIKPRPAVRMKLTDNVELGKNWKGYAFAEPVVRSLRQIQSAKLGEGGRAVFANLIYASDDQRPQQFAIAGGRVPSGWGTVVVASQHEAMLAGIGEPDSLQEARQVAPGLRLAARAFLMAETSGLAADCRELSWGDFSLRSEKPVTIQWSDGRLKLTTATPTRVNLTCGAEKPRFSGEAVRPALKDGQWSAELGGGERAIEIAGGFRLAGLEDVLRKMEKKPAAAPQVAEAEHEYPAGEAVWSVGPASRPTSDATDDGRPARPTYLSITTGDLDGDGADEIVAGSDDKNVSCFASDGRLRWKASAAGPVTATSIANLDRSGRKSVVAGSEDCRVYAFSPAGQKMWSFEMPYYKRSGCVRVLLAADLDADGHDEVIAGGDNWRYYALDGRGNELWHCESVHPSSAAAAADLDGDGKLEVLCGTVYHWWPCCGADGSVRWRYSVKGPHATVALSANLDGTNKRAAVFGAEDGNLHVLDPQGKLLWVRNVGDEVTGAVAVDLDGDGRDEIVAASLSFNLVALDGGGKQLWRDNLGDSILALTAADVNADGRPELVAGSEDGRIWVVDGHRGVSRGQGRIVGRFDAGSAVTRLASARTPGKDGPKCRIIAATRDGALTAVEW